MTTAAPERVRAPAGSRGEQLWRALSSASWVRGALGVLVLFGLFELLTRAELVNPRYLPPASTILARTAGLLGDPAFLGHVGATMQAWAVGLLLATVIAVPLGALLGSSSKAYTATHALVEFLRPIPSVALIPLAILLFGQGLEAKVFLVLYGCSWPILFNTIYGMHSVDPLAKDTARTFGLGRTSVLAHVAVPSAAPFIWTGIRVATAIALILVFSFEITGGVRGIGTYMLGVQSGGRQDLVYAATIVTGILGFLVNSVFVRVERRLFGWQPALREGR